MNTIQPSSPVAVRPTWLPKTIAYYAAFIILGLTAAVLGPTLQGLAENTGTLLSEISFLFSARALGYLSGSLLAGRLYDRYSGHRVIALALALIAVALALTPLISLLWLLAAVTYILGIAEGTADLGGNLMLVWVHRAGVGPFMNGLHFCFGLGAFLSPVIVAQALHAGSGPQMAYWILAGLALPVCFYILSQSSPPPEKATPGEARKPSNPLLAALVGLFFFLYVGAESSYGGWIFTYATRLGLGAAESAAYLTSAFWGALTTGRLLAIPIASRLRARWILLFDLLGCVASMLVILLFPTSLFAIWIGTLGLGACMASIFPTTLTFAERRMEITGKASSWFFVGAGAGGMVLPWLIGQLFERLGAYVTMYAILANLLLAGVVFAWMMFRANLIASPGQ